MQLQRLVLVLALVAMGLHAYRYYPFIADDALISLRYSSRLLAGLGLTWDSYQPVEGYSNLLWVLANAGVGLFGVDLVVASRLLGAVGMAAALGAGYYAARQFRWPGVLPLISYTSLLAASGTVAVWLIGGLEQPFIAGLLAWALVLVQRLVSERDPPMGVSIAAGVVLGLLVLTRPDSPLFVVAAVAVVLWSRGFSTATFRLALPLACIPAALYLGQLAFRMAYYGEWVPNTARVKIAMDTERLHLGWTYLAGGLKHLLPFMVAVPFVFAGAPRRHIAMSRIWVPSVAVAVWLVYVAIIGGDIFPARRHFIPVVICAAMILAELAAAIVKGGGRSKAAAWPAILAAICAFGWFEFDDHQNRRAIKERWEWKGQAIGLMLKEGFGDAQPLLATTAAGSLPYWSELPSIDMFGLNDRHIARAQHKSLGKGRLGHELGDGAYVLSRKPDIVIDGLASGRTDRMASPSGRVMRKSPEWRKHYVLVPFQARDPQIVNLRIFIRKTSDKIGIRRSADRIAIPGYLLTGNKQSFSRLDPNGTMAIVVKRGIPASLNRLPISVGRWRFVSDAHGAGGELLSAQVSLDTGVEVPMSDEGLIHVIEPGSLSFTLATESQAAVFVRQVRIERVSPRS